MLSLLICGQRLVSCDGETCTVMPAPPRPSVEFGHPPQMGHRLPFDCLSYFFSERLQRTRHVLHLFSKYVILRPPRSRVAVL